MSTIFISHSCHDNNEAESLKDWLQENGFDEEHFFLDFDQKTGIKVGQTWKTALKEARRSSEVFIFLITSNWLSSLWCRAELRSAYLDGKTILPALIGEIDPGQLPQDLRDELPSDRQWADLRGDARKEGLVRLATGLKHAGIDPDFFRWPPKDEPNWPPYPGLMSFEEADAAVFFGRNTEISSGLTKLRTMRRAERPRLLMMIGASGSGKSSLLKAGILPRLKRDAEPWKILPVMRPSGRLGETPVEALAQSIAQAFNREDTDKITRELIADTRGTVKALQDEKNKDRAVLLPIDQGEELLAIPDRDRVEFLLVLRELLGARSNWMSVVTTRADSLSGFQKVSLFHELDRELFVVDPMRVSRIAEVVEGPAKKSDIRMEPRLAETIAYDAKSTDALPLVAFAMRELYDRFGDKKLLTVADYEALGDERERVRPLENAVRHAANEVLQKAHLTKQNRAALRNAFVNHLVQINDEGNFVRRKAKWSALPERSLPVLNALIDRRLLFIHGDQGERHVEVAHEALLRQWSPLVAWLEEDRDRLRTIKGVQKAADDWDAEDRRVDMIAHRGRRLNEAREALAVAGHSHLLEAPGPDYLMAATHSRWKNRAQMGVLMFLLAIVVMSGLFIQSEIWQRRGFAELAKGATEQSRESIARIALAAIPPKDRGFLGRLAQSRNQKLALMDVLNSSGLTARIKTKFTGHGKPVANFAFSPDYKTIATASDDAIIRIWDIETGKELHLITAGDDLTVLRFSPDGTTLMYDDGEESLNFMDVKTEQTSVVELDIGILFDGHFSADGTQVLTVSNPGQPIIWNRASGAKIKQLAPYPKQAIASAYSKSGKFIFIAGENGLVVYKTGGELVLNTLPVAEQYELLPTGRITTVLFSPDEKYVVTGSSSGSVIVWDLLTGEKANRGIDLQAAHRNNDFNASSGVARIAISPDMQLLAVGFDTGEIRVFTEFSKILNEAKHQYWSFVLQQHDKRITSLSFVQKSDVSGANKLADNQLISASDDGSVRVWARPSNDHKFDSTFVIRVPNGNVYRAEASPDGESVAILSASIYRSIHAPGTESSFRLWAYPTPSNTSKTALEAREAACSPARRLDVGAFTPLQRFRNTSLLGRPPHPCDWDWLGSTRGWKQIMHRVGYVLFGIDRYLGEKAQYTALDRKTMVRKLQRSLADHKISLDKFGDDGVCGRETAAAIIELGKKFKLDLSGYGGLELCALEFPEAMELFYLAERAEEN